MTCRRVLLLIAATLFVAVPAADPAGLEHLLTRLARVAELYRDNALGFACQETISYTGSETGRIQFAYLFIRDEHGRLRDFRTWKTGTTAKERGQEVDPRDYRVPRFLESAYLWAFIFRSDRQPLYRFEVVGEGTTLGRSSLRIEFLPREPIRRGLNDWAGYAWVDRETTQILEVEAYTPSDWNRKRLLDADLAQEGRAYDIERIVTQFGFEKNGMRFPSHVAITTTRCTVVAGAIHGVLRESTVRKVTQDYSRFEFFTVRTREEIARFVDGAGPLPEAP